MKKWVVFIMLFSIGILSADEKDIKEEGIYASFETNYGNFICKLFYSETPVTVANFVGLAEGKLEFTDPKTNDKTKKQYFDGLTFHRIIKDFVIQGGDPIGNGMGGPGYKFMNEINDDLKFDSEGVLAMANAGPDTNGSQFFITLAPTPSLNGGYSIFGKIVSGMDTVQKIGAVKGNANGKPDEAVIMKKVSILRIGNKAKSFDPVKEFANQETAKKRMAEEKEKKLNVFLKTLGVDETKIETTKSGLRFFTLQKGTGVQPAKGQKISAQYAGYLTDGKKFDSSYDRNEPFETEIGVGRVIAGWDEAFLTMKEGEKRVLIIPYQLAYGERGYPGAIPPKATLIFVVELLKVK